MSLQRYSWNDIQSYYDITDDIINELIENEILIDEGTEIDDRYKIVVSYDSDNSENFIYCKIDDMDYSKIQGRTESGERLDCQAFSQGNMKLSIGIEYDIGYFSTEKGIGNYDYDCVYLKNGIRYHVFPSTKSQELTFGLAWINECTDDNNVQTWYGADPTIM